MTCPGHLRGVEPRTRHRLLGVQVPTEGAADLLNPQDSGCNHYALTVLRATGAGR